MFVWYTYTYQLINVLPNSSVYQIGTTKILKASISRTEYYQSIGITSNLTSNIINVKA